MRILAGVLMLLPVAAPAVVLSDDDRSQVVSALLADASAPLTVEFLAQGERCADLEDGLQALGAQVQFADRRVGFVRALVPRNQLLVALSLHGIEAASLPRSYPPADFIALDQRRAAAVPDIQLPIPKVASGPLTREGPYFPLAEVGMIDFWQQHPAADGRGIGIGFVDDGFDLLHPAIQRVRAPDGGLAPKVRDMVPVSTPEGDNSWVLFGEPHTSRAGRLSFADSAWRVPTDGSYRSGIFSIKLAPGSYYDPAAKTRAFTLSVGVLWNPSTNEVWVDTDGDRDFTNNRALRDYAVAQEIDWFGKVQSNGDHRIAFGVKIDAARGAVWLSLNGSGHGTWTGSAASGNQLTGGLFDAPAPNAQLIDVHDVNLTALLTAAARPDVDIINYSGGLGRPLTTGEEDFQRRVVLRAAAVYAKPILAASSSLPGTIAIHDYWSEQMSRRNGQLPAPHREAMNSRVWFTPDGTVNDLLAPSVTMPAVSRYSPNYYVDPEGRRHAMPDRLLSPAPDGYAIGSNPSCTIAYASGVVASVLSAAKQAGVRYDVGRLTNALFTGAQPVPGFAAEVQGHGLIRADGAWKQLIAMAKGDDPANPVLTRFELTRDRGEGLVAVEGYAEEFLTTGKAVERSLWITRRGGYARRTYRLELYSNNGTFKLAQSRVLLPRDRAVRIRFTVCPEANHRLSFLRVIDDRVNVVMQAIPFQTKAPDRMEELAPGVKRYRSSIPSHRTQSRTLNIEAGVQAVRTAVVIPHFVGMRRYVVGDATNERRMLATANGRGGPSDSLTGEEERREFTRVPAPGRLDVWWENRGRREYESKYDPPAPEGPITATLTLSHYAVAFERTPDGEVTLHNRLAEVAGRVEWLEGTPISHSFKAHAAGQGFSSIALMVPEKTAILRIVVTSKESRDGIVDVYAVDATDKTPVVVEQTELKGNRAELAVRNPKPGAWKISLWGRESSGSVNYEVATVALAAHPASVDFARYAHNSRSTVSPPPAASPGYARYAAFRIEPSGEDKEGLLIGVTPISVSAF